MNFNGINKAMIFPYSEYMINIIKFNDLFNFDIESIVSFKSWGYTDKDPLFIDKSGSSKYMVTDDFEGELNKVDTVILGSFEKYYGDDNIANKYLRKIVKVNKNVIILDRTNDLEIENHFKNPNVIIKDLNHSYRVTKNLNPINIPAVGIFGLEGDCGKIELQLKMYRALKNEGYKVSLIGANPELSLLGGHCYPLEIYSDKIGSLEKTKIIRDYINNIISKQKSDIVLVSSPYGLNNFGKGQIKYEYNGFLSQMIIDAIRPDANILCCNLGRNLGMIERSKKTLELISSAPTIALSSKRLYKSPRTSLRRYQIDLKKGILNDDLFRQYEGKCKEDLEVKMLDQDNIEDKAIVDLIEDTFANDNRIKDII
ncbi:hypothetical protein [Dethiothermospora halolimnae]|uniref:hypothetical protein n=1 Tax=Dethiothermospora halolimnae TaxID=3114390 RepID=UPI003CCC0679